jgi:tRNA pseudouridine38-40 synthase
MPLRVMLGVSYDGTAYHGFAPQPGSVTVGGELRRQLERIAGVPAPLTVAGRTDAGVHARTQVVHVDLPPAVVARFARSRAVTPPDGELPGLARALGSTLPDGIGVFRAAIAPAGFDARRSATSRRYRYELVTSLRYDPARARTTWMVGEPLDLAPMRIATDAFLGAHDFAAFARRPPGHVGPIERRVLEATWAEVGRDLLAFEIEAVAFAHQMVRSIVGALVAVGRGQRRPNDLVALLRSGVRTGAPTVAPARGLTLVAVGYPIELGGRWE